MKKELNLDNVETQALNTPVVITRFFMYKVVSECNNNEVLASGFYSKERAQKRIDEGYYHKFMYDKDKSKKLIVIEY